MVEFLHEVVWHSLLDTLKLVPFLFLTYLLMECLEHRAGASVQGFVRRAGRFGPLLGGAVGAVPQCGFSAAAAGLYAGRILSMGTLVAVFLSTSDEMLPLLVSGGAPADRILLLVGIKAAVGIAVGFLVDAFVRRGEDICVDALCEQEGCHCERGVLRSALRHTLHIGLFLLTVTVAIGAAVYFIGEDVLKGVLYDRPFVSHLVAMLVGFIPNCAASVALTELYLGGFVTAGTLLSGLLPGAGVGVLVLLRVNKHRRENLLILGILALTGLAVGLAFDLTGLSAALFSVG
jgi:hypothetical protein